MHKKSTYLLLGLFFLFGNIFGQESPKLGLVLSGGGAKGVAHIGALKAMEEAGLRPDFIAGTSMGAVIGSLYAVGYSATQIEQMILEIDWNVVLSNDVPLNYISFEEKEYYDRYLLDVPIDHGRVALTSGLIDGQMLTEVLMHYLWPSFEYKDFDALPIPYRCLATDVKTGNSIVFSGGSLPTAVRASMALPTAFSAVNLDTTLAVDGGVLNNFPVDIMREMGADYIIGVNVSAPSEGIPGSMIDILLSLATIPSEKKLMAQIEDCDIYLQPDMMGYSTASFSKSNEILQLGIDYANQFVPQFKALGQKMKMNREPFSRNTEKKELKILKINLKGNVLFSNGLILEKLGIDEGETVSHTELEEAIRRVYGINGFTKVDYQLDIVSDGAANLDIRMFEKHANHFLASIHADNIFSAGVLLNYTARDLLGKESRSIFALDISKNPRFRFDYYKYLGLNRKFAANFRYDFLSEQLPNYEQGEVTDVLINKVNRLNLTVLSTQSLRSSFAFGVFFENNRSKSGYGIVAPNGIKRGVDERAGLRFGYFMNSLNNRNFPTKGAESNLIISSYLYASNRIDLEDGVDTLYGDDGLILTKDELNTLTNLITPSAYFNVFYSYKKFIPVAKNLQVVPRLGVAVTLGMDETFTYVDEFRLGGWQRVWIDDTPLLGFQFGELATPNFGQLGMRLQHQFFKNFFLKYGADFLVYHSHIPLDQLSDILEANQLEASTTLGYGAELSIRTPLGPISGGLSANTSDGFLRYYFSLGFSLNYSD